MTTTEPPALDQRGVALVELAIVVPLLVMLAVASLEVGLAWVARNATGNAARAGGMAAVSHLMERDVDVRIVEAVVDDVEQRGDGTVERIIVYRGHPARSGPPLRCLRLRPSEASGIAGVCNVYGPDAISTVRAGGSFVTDPTCENALDGHWCPSERRRTSDEILGIHVEVGHESTLGILPVFDEMTLTATASVSGSSFGYLVEEEDD